MADDDGNVPQAPSSPACAAHLLDAAAGAPDPDVVERLNALLEAERAGAKVLGVLARDVPPDSDAGRTLAALQRDEADNAVRLFRAVRALGGAASTDVGDFVGKTLAVDGLAARLRFVNRGQGWVARKIDELLPRIAAPAVHAMLETMRDDHLRNIAACEALVARLEGGG